MTRTGLRPHTQRTHHTPRVRMCLAAALLLALVVPARGALAQDEQTAMPVPAASWKDSDQGKRLIDRADEIIELTRAFRGVGADAPVKKGLMLREELRAILLQKLEEENDDDAIRGELMALARLGLIDPALDYEQFILDLLTEQIAGFYDDETQELYILEGQDEATLDAVMSHELFHAIQDQTWSIARVRGPEDAHADLALARVALIEGDASAVMLDFELAPEGASFTDIPFLEGFIRGATNVAADASGSDVMSSAPLVIQESLIFPYVEGMLFVGAIKKAGGWTAVDAVYADPPMSTEQILHPERYLERDEPVTVDFDVPAELAEAALVYDEVHGELGIQLYLKQHLLELGAGTLDEALTAAAGWDGDRSRLYESPDGRERVFVQLVALDSVDDARELATSLDRVARLRYPTARHSDLALAGGGRGSSLFTGDEHLWIEQRGSEVLYVEGLSDATRGDGATQALRTLADTVWLTRSHTPYPAFATELPDATGPAPALSGAPRPR